MAALLLPLMMALSQGFGATWDESLQREYGERVYRYFASGFQDHSALNYGNLHLYGGMFDALCAVASRCFPANAYVVRHVVTSIFGWIGIVYTGRLAKQFGGPLAGLLAMILLALSPRYFGDAMNNPKDIPFAAMTAVATYYLAQGRRVHPYFQWKDALKLTLAIALAINVRAGGILLLCYLAALLTAFVALDRERQARRMAATVCRFALIFAASLWLGSAFWPWARLDPFVRPFEALSELTHFNWSGYVLYRGQYLAATSVPWDYPFVYLLITTPPVVLVGAMLTGGTIWRRQHGAVGALACWVLVLFPLTYVVGRGSTLYDGIRQLLFAYPPLVVAAAIGWTTLPLRTQARRIAASLVLTIGLAEPLVFEWKNHPNEIVYFNPFVGGPAGAVGRYDLDYWGNSILQAVAWSDGFASRTSQRIIISGGEPSHVVRDDSDRFRNLAYADARQGRSHLHIELFRSSPDKLAMLLRLPTLYVVRASDGAPLCLVQPGPRYGEIQSTLGRDTAAAEEP